MAAAADPEMSTLEQDRLFRGDDRGKQPVAVRLTSARRFA
jgi:hypothetical protein